MKKLGKKLSFLTKVMLVVGLLISNLSSLSVVFADEVAIDVNVVDGELNIKYLGELTDEVKKVRIDVYENYVFLDGSNLENEVSKEVSFAMLNTSDEEVVTDEMVENTDVVEEDLDVQTEELVGNENELEVVTNEVETVVEVNEDTNELAVATESDEILTDDTNVEVNVEDDTEDTEEVSKKIDLVIEESILASNVFDGRYDVEIKIVDITDEDNEEVIATRDYGMDVFHRSGIEYHLFDVVSNEELLLEDGKYSVSYTSPKVRIEGRLLAGGLSPKDMLMYNEGDYYAEDLVKEVFATEIDFNGRLYGDYTVPVAVEIEKYNRDTNEYELIDVLDENLNVNVLYGTYDLNTLAMNFATEELTLSEIYEFVGDAKDGVVYVLLDENRNNTMLDLYNIANYMFDGDDTVTFDLSNNEYENVISTFDESTATMSLTDMLANIDLEQNTVLSLVNEGLTITYKVVFAGDVNGDNVLGNEDLVEMIDQVLGNKDADLEKSDFYDKNGEVNTLDIIYLDQIIKTGEFNTTITEEGVQIDAELNVLEEEIVSGGKFTVELMVKLSDYAINGLGGIFTFDDTKLQLESIESVDEWNGNNNEGQFLYVGEESLELPVVEDDNVDNDVTLEDGTLTEDEDIDQEVEEIVVTEDYVVISAVFTALESGVHTVGVKNLEYFNQNVYYGVNEEEALVEVTVIASDNNNLSTLIVAGQSIELVEGQLEYEITVGNDVTVADVEAVLENVSANITSIVSPEELVEGENIITITVVAENGDEKVYTVKVIREASQEEANTQTNYNNYQDYNNDNNDEEDDNVVTTSDEEDDDEDDDKKQEESNLSRIVIIILILLVIAGLIYLIFKDEDDEETMRVNKDINKLKKEVREPEVKKEVKTETKVEKKPNNSGSSKNSNNNRNKKKDR